MEEITLDSGLSWPYAVTLVLAADNPQQRRWAVSATIEIVRQLTGERAKVILTDLQTRRPSSLAAELGVEEGPGITDVLLRGASFSEVAHRPESESFFFMGLGNDPPTPEVLFGNPRWEKISAKLPGANAHLLICVSAEDWVAAGPAGGFEACVVLNATGREIALPAGARPLAEFLAPPEVRLPADLDDGAPAEAEAAEDWNIETRPLLRPDLAAAGSELAPPAASEEAGVPWRPVGVPGMDDDDEVGGSLRSRRRESPRILSWIVRHQAAAAASVVTAVVLLFVALYFTRGERAADDFAGLEAASLVDTVASDTPSPEPRAAEPRAEPPAPQPVSEPAAPRPLGTALPYSVLLASFSSYDDALSFKRARSRAAVPLYIAPTPVRGVLYYRVLAGMLAEREQAQALMARLVREGIKETASNWDVRPARFAYRFGTYLEAREAEASVTTLNEQGVPAYMLPALEQESTDTVYQVYAGGFEGPNDARLLGEVIQRTGLDAELVERVGLLAQ